jgi:cystathionine beta-lyase/cystathionine gamma-synthase
MGPKEKGISTLLNHPPRVELKSGNLAIVAPIYQTAKFVLSQDMPYSDQFVYSRVSNPTLTELEMTLALLQGEEESVVFASGLAAITNSLLALLKTGDHLLFFREIYRPTRVFINQTLKNFGIESSMIPLEDFEQLENNVKPGKTKVLYFESPTNPNLKVADISKLRAFCDQHKILLVMDNTFAGPHQHHGFGVDLFIHSLTKFVNGHGDVIAGAAIGKSSLIKKIRPMAVTLGATLDPHAAFLVQRGLRTYELRYSRQTKTASELAAWFKTHKMVKKVYYPEGELAQKQMKDMGAMVSLELDPICGFTAQEFCHRLKLIQFAVSLGSAETLINPSLIFFGDDLATEDREQMGINPYSLRISVGLENIEDIKADFDSGFMDKA